MEPHSIPQNVTTFQFRLIGDMTLKQFLYLAIGSSIAYFLFIFLSPIYPIVVWPLIIISASLGAAFAFVPIGSRPLDHWLAAFLKAIYSPTKRSWQKNGKNYKEDPLFGSRFAMYSSGQGKAETEQIRKLENINVGVTPVYRSDLPISSGPLSSADLPTQEQLQKTVDLARQAQNLQGKIVQTERTLNQIRYEAGHPTPIPIDYTEQVNKVFSDLQKLVSQASTIKQQLDNVNKPQSKNIVPTQVPPLYKEQVKIVIPVKPKQTQLALTSFPNVINGIIKDLGNNYLDGVVVVIYDKEGLPVRALKSNKLGQFSGSTPLPNGTYKVELEKDGFTFDVLQIELDGHVLPPLLISAK